MVGKEDEQAGIAVDDSKMATILSCAKVPKFTKIIGGSHGTGNDGMCGRAFSIPIIWSWPNTRIIVMGEEQAASLLATIKQKHIEASAKKWSTQEEDYFKWRIREQYEHHGNPYYGTARL